MGLLLQVQSFILISNYGGTMKVFRFFIILYLAMDFFSNTSIFASSSRQFKLLVIDTQKGEPYETVRKSMLSELSGLGYKKGKNLTIKYYSLGNFEGRAKSIWKYREKKNIYDVIFLNGTIAVKAFKSFALDDHNKFVFASVTDPVGEGVIEDFEYSPKHNFTGICYPVKVVDRLRFIKKVFPTVKKIGLIHSDMPQSHSYNRWLKETLKNPEFRDLEIIFRKVPFVKSEEGHIRMVKLAEKYVEELNSTVDIFLSPNDQMDAQPPFAKMVYASATKPLVGLGRKDAMDGWGATMSIYPDLKGAGKQIAHMIEQLFKGKPIKDIIPKWPSYGVAFD